MVVPQPGQVVAVYFPFSDLSQSKLRPAICLAACSAGKEAEPAPLEKTVFNPLTQQLDRAEKVQGSLDTHAADTRKQLEAAENGEGSH